MVKQADIDDPRAPEAAPPTPTDIDDSRAPEAAPPTPTDIDNSHAPEAAPPTPTAKTSARLVLAEQGVGPLTINEHGYYNET
jgi:hypothetical protein